MAIDYTPIPNPLTPGDFRPEVLTKNTRTREDVAARLAEKTGLPLDAAAAILGALPVVFTEFLLDGDAIVLQDFIQVVPTLSGRIASPTSDLPPDSTAGLSLRAIGGLLSGFKSAAQFHRVAGASKSPEILEIVAISGALTAMHVRDLLDLLGNRLKCDPSRPNEGVFFDPVAGGAPIKALTYTASGPKKVSVQIPAGLTVGAQYRVRIEARLTQFGELRHFTWPGAITAA